MSYKVRFEIEFPWTVEEAEAAEWLLVRRYGLHGVSHNRLPRAIYQATLEAVEREAIESAAAFAKVLKKGGAAAKKETPMNIDDLNTPWFVLEEADTAFPDVTWHRICHGSEFGPVEIAALQSFQDYPHTHRRRRMAYLMAAPPALYEALQELFQLLEEHQPTWYLRGHYNLAANALASAEPPGGGDVTPPVEPTFPAYPWPDEEMIARYGLRYLTPEEQQVFPGLRLVLDVLKARLTRPPAAVPRSRTGWVVWIAETYPGQYHIRLPGGATLLAPYHDIAWEHVPVETPATTIEDIRAEEKRLQAEARKWRPGQVVTTPGTRLSWDSLAGWIAAWQKLQRRAHSSDRYWKESQHIRALPVEMIAAETDEAILYDFLDLMNRGDARPPKGMRTEHPTTPLVVAAHNRLVQLGAMPYRQYRHQQSLRRALAGPASTPTRKRPSGEEAAPHLSLF